MVGNVIDGKAVAARIRVELSAQVAVLKRDYGRVSGGWRHLTSSHGCLPAFGGMVPVSHVASLHACMACMPCIPRGIVHSCGVAFMSLSPPAPTSRYSHQVPGLAVVIVGERKDSQTYVRMKRKACEEVRSHAAASCILNGRHAVVGLYPERLSRLSVYQLSGSAQKRCGLL